MTNIKYTKEILQEAVLNSTSYAGVLRYLGLRQSGGSQTHIKNRIKEYNLDLSHFVGQAWSAQQKISNKADNSYVKKFCIILPDGSERIRGKNLTKALLENGTSYLCAGQDCPNPEPVWAGKELPLTVDHIDGDFLNNLLSNLRFLCPNCHRQTETYSVGIRRKIVSYCTCGKVKRKSSRRCADCVKNSNYGENNGN